MVGCRGGGWPEGEEEEERRVKEEGEEPNDSSI